MAEAEISKLKIVIDGEVSDSIAKLESLISKLESLQSATVSVEKTAESATTSATKVFSVVERLNKASDKLTASVMKFGASLKKILVYRLLRGGISQIVKDLEQGKKNIEAYDKAFKAMTGESSASKAASIMKEIAENTTLLKNTLASLFMTVYASFQPAINAIVEGLRNAMNVVNQFLSALMGRDSYTKAVKGISDVSSAAGALKKQIFGFDELNILKAPDGGISDQTSKMFEEADVSAWAKKLAEISKAFQDTFNTTPLIAGLTTAGLIIGGWKLGEILTDFVIMMRNPRLQLAIGATLVIAGVAGLYDSLKDAFEGEGSSAIMAFASSGAIIAGGTLIGRTLGSTMLGVLGGLVVTGIVGLIASIGDIIENGLTPLNASVTILCAGLIGTATGILVPGVTILGGAVAGAFAGALGILLIYLGTHWDDIEKLWKEGTEKLKERWSGMTDDIKTGWHDIVGSLGTYLDDHKEEFATKFGEFFENPILNSIKLIRDALVALFGFMADVAQAYNDIVKDPTSAFSQFTSKYGKPINSDFDGGQLLKDTQRSINVDAFNLSDDAFFADGGFPARGDLFIANENAPELVGNFGGRTGVYNQEQFAGAMAIANESVVQAVLAIGSQITTAVNEKPVPSFKIGDRDIAASAQRGATLRGASLIQGAR